MYKSQNPQNSFVHQINRLSYDKATSLIGVRKEKIEILDY